MEGMEGWRVWRVSVNREHNRELRINVKQNFILYHIYALLAGDSLIHMLTYSPPSIYTQSV
jgi:hypothetical protein